MRRTFYVATSFTNREQAQKVAHYLQDKGMRWVYNHDWTLEESAPQGDPKTALLMLRDLQSAVGADIFVLLLKSPLTIGAHVELGARLGVNKEAHLVVQGTTDWHPFHDHPGVVRHDDLDAFINAIL